ncbi:helix-turn-helix domain-containing protein [Celeribacter baekdonensis]|uniref:winged helix-turn-helix transcriptional regulator n=1 Tax=Celeribacter baekdonensis TaxID=875171 RepID=UPI0030D72DC1|tara:strand:- start:2518 stop:2976 length:459 start_codon:yes stop_codon:yes gene_type:complete
MKRKSFADMNCPIASSLELIGEGWSFLIIRDAFAGLKVFDDFEQSLGIAPSTLTRRLNSLVDAGMLERRQYCERPPRYEYHLTQPARDLYPVFLSLYAWGNTHILKDERSFLLIDRHTGEEVDPLMVDRQTGVPLEEPIFRRLTAAAPDKDQ